MGRNITRSFDRSIGCKHLSLRYGTALEGRELDAGGEGGGGEGVGKAKRLGEGRVESFFI